MKVCPQGQRQAKKKTKNAENIKTKRRPGGGVVEGKRRRDQEKQHTDAKKESAIKSETYGRTTSKRKAKCNRGKKKFEE